MKKFVLFAIAVVFNHMAFSQISLVKKEIEKVIDHKKATVGVALYDFTNGETLNINGEKRFPMQSVFKFHVALAVLNEVDHKKFELNQNMIMPRADLHPNTWSPIREKYPEGDVQLTLSEIIKYNVSQSDNNACDLLLKMLGGASTVNTYIHNKGISDVNIEKNEQELNMSWDAMFINWTTPKSLIELLKLFHNQKLLDAETHSFLWQAMLETSTGSIKDKLPQDAVVAHKTGASGFNEKGVSAATNDVGIMVLPDGRHIAFAIFITDSNETAETNYSIIAEIANLVYNSVRD